MKQQTSISVLLIGSFIGLLSSNIAFAQVHGRDHQADWPDSLEINSVEGTVRVDLSFMHELYYLDTLGTGSWDYRLLFGPWWYEPASGASRPLAGEFVSIRGGLMDQMTPPGLAVYEIDGSWWRDSTGAPPWSGGWVHRGATDTTVIYCPTDSLSRLHFPPSSMMGMKGPDSIYCQFEQVDHDSLPPFPHGQIFGSFHADVFDPMGGSMMGNRMMGFQRSIRGRFHVDPDTLAKYGMSVDNLIVFFLDTDNVWKPVSDQLAVPSIDILVTNQSGVSSFYVVTSSAATAVDNGQQVSLLPSDIALYQNYPNPFNPTTRIEFSLPSSQHVRLAVYDLLGQRVRTLFDDMKPSGYSSVQWDGRNGRGVRVSGGIYHYVLQVGGIFKTGKMTFLP